MVKRVYSCDIHRGEVQDPNKLRGINFKGIASNQFKIDTYNSTDGVHICIECLKQLREQLKEPSSLEKI